MPRGLSGVIRDAARGLGVTLGAVNAAAWAFAMWVPTGGLTLAGFDLVVAFLMCIAGVVAVIAAVRGHSHVLLGAFLVSFLPVGAFVLTLDHWLSWIGMSDLGLLVSAAVLRFTRPMRAGDGDAAA